MSINTNIYKDKFSYTAGTNTDSRYILTTTESLKNLLTLNPDWQKEQIWDNSNVYSNFDPSKYGYGSFGSVHTDITFEPVDWTESGYESFCLKSFTGQPSGDAVKINLRYVFSDTAYALASGGFNALMWTGYDSLGVDFSAKRFLDGEQCGFTDPYYSSGGSSYPNNDTTIKATIDNNSRPLNDNNYKFVTDIDRNAVLFGVYVRHAYIDSNRKLQIVDLPTELIEQHRLSGEPYIMYNQQRCFLYDTDVRMYVKSTKEEKYVRMNWMTRQDLDNGTSENIMYSRSPTFNLYMICEKIINGRTYYYSMPIVTAEEQSFSLAYYRVHYADGNKTYGTSMLNPWGTSAWSAVVDGLDSDTYNHIHSFHNIPAFDIPIDTDWSNSAHTWTNYENGFAYECYEPRNHEGYRNMKPYVSMDELYRIFACSLIPFKIMSNTESADQTFDTETNNMFIGVRTESGEVAGDYIPFKLFVDEAEKQFRPDDYEPVDPEQPYEPNPDYDTGDVPLGNIDPTAGTDVFTTKYIMDAAGLDVLSQSLWGGINQFDPNLQNNMIDNFFLNRRNSETYDLDLTLSNLIDYFVNIRYYPIPNLVALAALGGALPNDSIYVGTGATPIKTKTAYGGSDAYKVFNNVISIDGGSVVVPSSGRFTDFEPNTSISLYIPFCGTTDLMPSQVAGSVLTLEYIVDLNTGEMLAICCKNGWANYPVAIMTGRIGFDMMISGNNANSQGLAASISRQQFLNRQQMALFGNTMSAIGQALEGNWGSAIMGAGTGAANAVMETINYNLGFPLTAGSRPMSCGSPSSVAGMRAPQQAYIQYIQHNPKDTTGHGESYGKMANVWGAIGSVSGFVQVQNPKLEVTATQAEINELHQLLQSGVFI